MLLPCSRNARPKKGLVRRPQLEQTWVPCLGDNERAWMEHHIFSLDARSWEHTKPLFGEGVKERIKEREMAARCLLCSQNAHDETVLVRCAQSRATLAPPLKRGEEKALAGGAHDRRPPDRPSNTREEARRSSLDRSLGITNRPPGVEGTG